MWGSAVQVRAGLHLGGLAQLARAPALQAGGQGFDSLVLHYIFAWIFSDCLEDSAKKNGFSLYF